MTVNLARGREFAGKISVDSERVYLEAGGIRVELIGLDERAGAELRALHGVTARIAGEQDGGRIVGARPAPPATESAGGSDGADPALVELLPLAKNPPEALQQALSRVRERIVGVRPGYELVGTAAQPALVVLTRGTATAEELGIPRNIGEVRIAVQAADPEEQMLGPALLAHWSQVLADPRLEAPGGIPDIKYTPPTDTELVECKVSNIVCHVGPDAGWKTLGPFLDATEASLTVAMYDFNGPQIVNAMVDLGKNSDRSLRMVLQEDKDDESQAIGRLKNAWKTRLNYTAALVHGANRIFNNSFHTKVAVRDGKAFWLSSGNWSPNSQPEIPDGPQPGMYRLGNREWHVIIEDEKLSSIFEKFIQHDFKQASQPGFHEEAGPSAMPDLLVPESFFFEPEAAVVQPAPFEPKKFATSGEKIRVQPLMTPDNYPDAILELIEGAADSLWMQYAYVRAPKENDKFKKLVKAVAGRMKAGLDVRVLLDRRNEKPADIQALIALGWKPSMMRLQRSPVHNKGILVDSKIAVVGSQNWSADGTQYNRDASLILHSAQIAKYFGKVFEFDWMNLGGPVSMQPETAPVIAPESGPTPRGMIRVPWSVVYQEA